MERFRQVLQEIDKPKGKEVPNGDNAVLLPSDMEASKQGMPEETKLQDEATKVD